MAFPFLTFSDSVFLFLPGMRDDNSWVQEWHGWSMKRMYSFVFCV
jgi:hypothetical protein